jgi:hypothetical protein
VGFDPIDTLAIEPVALPLLVPLTIEEEEEEEVEVDADKDAEAISFAAPVARPVHTGSSTSCPKKGTNL